MRLPSVLTAQACLLVLCSATLLPVMKANAEELAGQTEISDMAGATSDKAGSEKSGGAIDHEERGEVHLENDPIAANISPGAWGLIEFRTDMALFSAVVFLLLMAGLAAMAWKPIMEGLDKRERGIADNIARAEGAVAAATAKLAEYEAKLAGAAEVSQKMLTDARKDAEATGQKLIAAAQEEAAIQRDRAVADIESAKRLALSELANQSTQVAMSMARRVVGREVRAEDHQSLIQDMLANVSNQPSNN